MPYDLFWHGPISAFFQYKAAYYKRLKEKVQEENRVAWLHGAYVKRAIDAAFSSKEHPYPYPQEPIRKLTPEEERKKQAMTDMIERHNEQMWQIQEQQAIKLQQQLIAKTQEAISHVGTDHRYPEH